MTEGQLLDEESGRIILRVTGSDIESEQSDIE